MKQWIIINMTRVEDGPWGGDSIRGGKEITPKARPSYIHDDYNEALAEIVRLKRVSGDHYILFEAVAEITTGSSFVVPVEYGPWQWPTERDRKQERAA